MKRRNIIQIATTPAINESYFSQLLALCDDGTLWFTGGHRKDALPLEEAAKWRQLPNIPQPEECDLP